MPLPILHHLLDSSPLLRSIFLPRLAMSPSDDWPQTRVLASLEAHRRIARYEEERAQRMESYGRSWSVGKDPARARLLTYYQGAQWK